jgi:DNA invertase Pin-like site-specific DNA recombinase
MKAALYARVSTRDKGQDVENQLRQLREFADKQGWEIAGEYIDKVSGSGKKARPQFQAMMLAASQRQFDVLLFWSLDRLSREGVMPTLQYLQRLDGYGVAWRSFTEQYLDSTGIFKEAVLAILATVAKQERLRISERVMAGLETARKKGKALGRPSVNRTHDKDAAAIRKMRDAGDSYDSIADELGRSKSDVYRVCMTLNCSPAE